jgi:hypothetical protein
VPLIPDQARCGDDQRDAGEGAHDSRHLGVSLQACNQAAGQGGPRIRQLFLQPPFFNQARLISSNAVLNKIKLLETVLFYGYGTGIKFIGTVPVLNL